MQYAGFLALCRLPYSLQLAGFLPASMQGYLCFMQCAGFHTACRLPCSEHAGISMLRASIQCAGFLPDEQASTLAYFFTIVSLRS